MAELTPEASRLYRVRKTTVKMLHNRCAALSCGLRAPIRRYQGPGV
jgi:hypothetical protein